MSLDVPVEQRLKEIAEITATACLNDSLDEYLSKISDRVCLALDADSCIIRELVGESLVLRACAGVDPALVADSVHAFYGIGNELITTRRSLTIFDTHQSDITVPSHHDRGQMRSRAYAGSPMIASGEILGVIGVYMRHTTREFKDVELLHLQTIANHVAVMLVNDRLMREMRLTNEELDRRVAIRTQQLRAANDDLHQFTYAIGHDLRSPLRAVVEYGRIVRQIVGDSITPEASEMLDRQEGVVGRISSLLDGLLAFARLGAEAIHLKRFDLGSMSCRCWQLLSESLPENNAILEVEPDLEAVADPGMAEIILQNLLENSVKFRSETRPLVVKIGRNGVGEYFVSDNGIGFDMNHAGRLFSPMERLVGKSEYPGHGLGLATVKRIVDHHSGSVRVDSQPDVGTTVYFRFGNPPSAVILA